MPATTLGLTDAGGGIGSLMAPFYATDFFGLSIAPSAELLGRLFGLPRPHTRSGTLLSVPNRTAQERENAFVDHHQREERY